MKTFRARTSIIIFAALAAYCASAVSTEEQDPPSIRIRYDDLNLSAASGVEALKRRVLNAAKRVCSEEYAGDDLSLGLQRACARRAADRALAQINWPQK